MAKADLTAERVRQLFDYEPESGILRWRPRAPSEFANAGAHGSFTSRCAGKDAARVSGTAGYRMTVIAGHKYLTHRLVWLHVTGSWPKETIDHINGIRSDNRIANLREATQKENCQHKPALKLPLSGVRGVSRATRSPRWRATINVNGRMMHLGVFDTPEEAGRAYWEAKAKYHPFSVAKPQ